jgi:hypothetical protein
MAYLWSELPIIIILGYWSSDAPDLCADRVDYALREFSRFVAEEIIDGLRVKDNMMVLVDRESCIDGKRVFEVANRALGRI